jgi:hypothetical protein
MAGENPGHTFSLGGKEMSIPLCTVGINHVWRFVIPIAASGLWQCDSCKTLAQGRLLNEEELRLHREKKEIPPVKTIEAPR